MRKILFIFLLFLSMHVHAVCTNSGTALTATTAVSNIFCTTNDGIITVNAINGWVDVAAPNGTGYSYAITAGPLTRPSQASNIFNALSVGTYTISITDCNGTTITVSATVAGTAPTTISYTPTLIRSVCANNNAVKINPSGGRPPYTITIISAPAGSGTPVIRGDTIFNLAAGTLNSEISDACGTILGITTTIATFAPIPTSAAMSSFISYGGCNGVVGDLYLSRGTPYIRYGITLSTGGGIDPNLVVDSFYTDLFFNGVYQQTLSPTSNSQLTQNYLGLVFNGYGAGAYTLKTYSKCGGLIKTDSVRFGNRPAAPTGSNTRAAATDVNFTRLGCTDFDFLVGVNNAYGGVLPLGQTYDVINPKFKVRILSGASRVGDSAYSSSTYVYSASLTNLLYSATPYSIELSDTCGNKDTLYFTRPAPTFSKTPTAAMACDGATANPNYFGVYSMILGPLGIPKVFPMRATFSSGSGIDYTAYPFTIIDSFGLLAPIVPRIPVKVSGTILVAYENGCGQKDTTLWTPGCPTYTPSTVSITKTPLCGNRGDIKFTQTSPGSPSGLIVYPVQWPTGSTLSYPTIALNRGSATNTLLNQPAGTYRLRGVPFSLASWNSPAGTSKTTDDIFYISGFGNTTPDVTANYGFPISGSASPTSFQSIYRSSVTWSGSIDTSKLRMWDTTFTLVIDSTNLKISATEAYLCKDGISGATIIAKAVNNLPIPNFQYSLSTTAVTGPWSTPQTDSLLVLAGVTGSTPVWVRATDVCGSTATTNTTVGTLTSTTLGACDGAGIATITPNPNTSSFVYVLRSPSGTLTTFPYGTPITIDLSTPAGIGTYSLCYKLASAGTTGCVVDSVPIIASFPCALVTVALPLNLLSFEGRLQAGNANVKWVATESGIMGYELQRSYNGQSWTTVYLKNAIGDGTHSYTYDDAVGNQSQVFYRLRIKEKDGSNSYSATLILKQSAGKNTDINIYPNPAQKQIYILLSGEVKEASMGIVDVLGKTTFYGKQLTAGVNTYDISGLAAGVYWVRIINDGAVTTKQITIR